MEFCRFLRSVKFVVRALGRFLGRGVCLWFRLKRYRVVREINNFR